MKVVLFRHNHSIENHLKTHRPVHYKRGERGLVWPEEAGYWSREREKKGGEFGLQNLN